MSNMELVAAELEAAKKKHRKFIDRLLPDDEDWLMGESVKESLAGTRRWLRRIIREHVADFYTVLEEEILEVAEAYEAGDLAHAKQELAQCAAVCIRGMEWIDEEMKEREAAK